MGNIWVIWVAYGHGAGPGLHECLDPDFSTADKPTWTSRQAPPGQGPHLVVLAGGRFLGFSA